MQLQLKSSNDETCTKVLKLQQENDYWKRKSKVRRTWRNEKMRTRKKEVVWLKVLICTNYQCDWSMRRYKAATLIKIHVI